MSGGAGRGSHDSDRALLEGGVPYAGTQLRLDLPAQNIEVDAYIGPVAAPYRDAFRDVDSCALRSGSPATGTALVQPQSISRDDELAA
jgi:hypothetical protein